VLELFLVAIGVVPDVPDVQSFRGFIYREPGCCRQRAMAVIPDIPKEYMLIQRSVSWRIWVFSRNPDEIVGKERDLR
jgi:hypothetical protein